MKPQMLIFMGAPGVGKGTFARMLCARHNFKYIESGAILRAMPDGSEIREIIDGGNLLPDDLLLPIIIREISNNSDVLLDGFPRTLSQAQWVIEYYATKFNIIVLYMDAPMDVAIARIQKRIREGSTRNDDTASVIGHRIENFQTQTMPAIEWLRTAPGICFKTVDANGSTNENFAEIVVALHSCQTTE